MVMGYPECVRANPDYNITTQCRLKYCTSRSCFSAPARDLKVPRLRRLPVFGFTLREYSRYSPLCNLRIMGSPSSMQPRALIAMARPRSRRVRLKAQIGHEIPALVLDRVGAFQPLQRGFGVF